MMLFSARFASHDVEQPAMILVDRRHSGKHADRPGDGGQGIANFVRDSGSQTSNRCQAVLHADFTFQATNLGEIVKE